MRERGTGSVLKIRTKNSKGDVVESRYWYIFYRVDGRLVRESSKSESKMVSEKLLQRRMGEAGLGMTVEQDVKRIKYDACRDALLAEYINRGVASLWTMADGTQNITGLKHLNKFFSGMPVTRITPDTLRRFIKQRRDEGAKDATIRRNLSLLRSMLSLARKEGRLRHQDIPHFPMPNDSAPRKGFVDPGQFEQVLEGLPENLRPLVTFMYYTGCRLGAAKQITWAMVTKDCSEVELPGEITKSGDPLTLPLVGKGLDTLAAMLRKMFRKSGPVFDTTNLRIAWYKATQAAGMGRYDKAARHYEGLTLHDLRRSAVRNLIRAGVSEDVAMKITGHKTRSVFSRYNITAASDVREALVKVGQYAQTKR